MVRTDLEFVYLMGKNLTSKTFEVVKNCGDKLKLYDYETRGYFTIYNFKDYKRYYDDSYLYKNPKDENKIKILITKNKLKKVEAKYILWKDMYECLTKQLEELNGIQQ